MIDKQPLNGSEPQTIEVLEDGIVHCDATVSRRERMRSLSNQNLPKPNVPQQDSKATESNRALPKRTEKPEGSVPVDAIAPWKSRVLPAANSLPVSAQVESSKAAQQNDNPKPVSVPTQVSAGKNSPVSTSTEKLSRFLVQFVVEQTGYPEDIVEADSDLEADLGIDSIKKALMFGEINEYFHLDLEQLEGTNLDDFKTIQSIVDFLSDKVTSPNSQSQETYSPPPAQPIESNLATVMHTKSYMTDAKTDEPQGTLNQSQMQRFLVQFVVEQTGYPEDIVELDSDLEADLGIDSIKKALMFGELNEYFGLDLQSIQGLSLDDFKTLRSILSFLTQQANGKQSTAVGSTKTVTHVSPTTNTSASHTASSNEIEKRKRFLVQFVVEQTGYPEDIVDMDADLEADLGIDSIKKAQMFGELNEYFNLSLENLHGHSLDDFATLGKILDFLNEHAS